MVLAAGLGTRLWPLTADRAKPAVPFLGAPLVRRLVAHLARQGVGRVVVNTHHRPESVRAALAGAEAELGVEIAFSHEDEILGTAGCLRAACDRGLLDPARPVLVVNGKIDTDLDLTAALSTHAERDAAVTMVLLENPARAAFRAVHVADGRVTGFGEGRQPPLDGPVPLMFTGIHVLGPEALAAIPPGFGDTVRDVYPPFVAAGRVAAHLTAGRWWEFSTLARYVDLHVEAAARGLGPDVVREPDTEIHPSARVERAVLWRGSRIGAGAVVSRAVLGEGVSIPTNARVADEVVIRADRRSEAPEGTDPGERWTTEGGDLWRVRIPDSRTSSA